MGKVFIVPEEWLWFTGFTRGFNLRMTHVYVYVRVYCLCVCVFVVRLKEHERCLVKLRRKCILAMILYSHDTHLLCQGTERLTCGSTPV